MVAESGSQLPTSSIEHLLIVIIFSIFHIVTLDVPYYDHRCAVSNAPHAAPSVPSAAPTAPPRARDKMDGTHICTARELMRWLTALLCFVDETYDTLEKGNCQRPEENTKKHTHEHSEENTKKHMQEHSEENTTKNMRGTC